MTAAVPISTPNNVSAVRSRVDPNARNANRTLVIVTSGHTRAATPAPSPRRGQPTGPPVTRPGGRFGPGVPM
jgi:hypothetical protein